MSANKKELGKGIRALLESIDDRGTEHTGNDPIQSNISREIPLVQIEVNPFQPRADFNEELLNELAESIKVHGIIQPITVRWMGNNRYQLISGERRLRAAKMAGLTHIPAYIRKANDQEMLEIALIENIQREDLNAIEVAINYQRLIEECNLTQEQLAQRIGKNRTTVTNFLRLLKLPPEIQHAIKTRKITMGHARAILGLEDVVMQLHLCREVIGKGLSVREVEKRVQKLNKQEKPPAAEKKKPLPVAYQKIQDDLSALFETKVTIKPGKKNSGKIIIDYFSDDDLNRILEILER